LYGDLGELSELVRGKEGDAELYVRWSTGPHADGTEDTSADPGSLEALTGVPLRGLSGNPL
jgi:hypothetical protein